MLVWTLALYVSGTHDLAYTVPTDYPSEEVCYKAGNQQLYELSRVPNLPPHYFVCKPKEKTS